MKFVGTRKTDNKKYSKTINRGKNMKALQEAFDARNKKQNKIEKIKSTNTLGLSPISFNSTVPSSSSKSLSSN